MHIFIHNAIAHFMDYSCKHNFHMHQETKKFTWLSVLQYLLYCSGLEPNLEYPQGRPV